MAVRLTCADRYPALILKEIGRQPLVAYPRTAPFPKLAPVAAFPVRGPIDVIRDPSAGILAEDLRTAALAALNLDPADRLQG